MADLFIAICLMPFLAPILDNADPLCALVITPGFYLHHDFALVITPGLYLRIEVADQDPACGSL